MCPSVIHAFGVIDYTQLVFFQKVGAEMVSACVHCLQAPPSQVPGQSQGPGFGFGASLPPVPVQGPTTFQV